MNGSSRPAGPTGGDRRAGTAEPRNRPGFMIVGALLSLVGVPLLVGGLALGWALMTQRDGDGFFTTPTEHISSPSVALTTRALDLGDLGPDDWWADRDVATVRLRVTSREPGPVFVGIGPSDAVAAYLRDAPYDEITDITDNDPFRYTLTRHGGDADSAPAPTRQGFWTAQASGGGSQELTWDLRPGTYTVVVMNADGTAGVDVDVVAGGRLALLTPLAAGLVLVGLALVAAGALLLVRGAGSASPGAPPARPGTRLTADETPPSGFEVSPVRVTGIQDAHLSRGLWLVKWVLVLPHLVILAALWLVFAVLTVVAFASILFTERYPRSIFDLNVGILRWSWRVAFYATSALGTDRYPPFSLTARDYPADLDVAYPERLSRRLVLVKSWLLALPHLIVLSVLSGTWGWTFGNDGARLSAGGLIGALTFAAGLLLLFTGRYPSSLFDLLIGLNRWTYRVIAYVALMTDQYPPFRLDQGPTEPGPGQIPGSFTPRPDADEAATEASLDADGDAQAAASAGH